MSLSTCKECEEIYHGLLELVETSRRTKPGPNATPGQHAAWFDQRDADENFKMRERIALSTLKERLIEHKKRTGHHLPSPLAGGLNSPN